MITPTVGRQVWYRPTEFDKAGAGAMCASLQPLAATICAVWGPRMVNLLVIDSNGKLFAKPSTTLLQQGDTPPAVTGGGGYAEWPAHQAQPAAPAAAPAASQPDLGPLETGEADAVHVEPVSLSPLPIGEHIEALKPKAPRLTPAAIEACIASEHYGTAEDLKGMNLGHGDVGWPARLRLLTICVLVLRNGYTVTGTSACASPANFNAELGRKIARAAAVEKVWPLEGYLLREQLHLDETFGPAHLAAAQAG